MINMSTTLFSLTVVEFAMAIVLIACWVAQSRTDGLKEMAIATSIGGIGALSGSYSTSVGSFVFAYIALLCFIASGLMACRAMRVLQGMKPRHRLELISFGTSAIDGFFFLILENNLSGAITVNAAIFAIICGLAARDLLKESNADLKSGCRILGIMFALYAAVQGVRAVLRPTMNEMGGLSDQIAMVDFISTYAAMAVVVGWSLGLLWTLFNSGEYRLRLVNEELEAEIVERKRTARDLKESEARVRAIMDNSPSFIYLKDVEGRYTHVNKPSAEDLGVPAEEIVGLTSRDFYTEEIAAIYVAQDREVIETQTTVAREIVVPDIDGNIEASLVTKFPIFDSNGDVASIGAVIVDITELKRVEEALRESEGHLARRVAELTDREKRLEEQAGVLTTLAEEVSLTRDELQQLNDQKDKFFSIIAHDLKSPFNALLGFSQILSTQAESMEPAKVAEYGSLVHQAADQAFKLLEDLLDWSRLQLGRMNFEPEPIDVRQIIKINLTRYEPVAVAKDIELNESSMEDVEAFADPNMVDTVLRNLISNAIKFTPEKKIVTIGAIQDDNCAKITVSDRGVGMSAEKLARLFKIDEKVSTNGTAGETGTGLGLQLCKELVEKQGGQIFVESTEGEGSVFSFTLPVQQKKG